MNEGTLVMAVMVPIMRSVIRTGIILRGGEYGVACSITRVTDRNDGGETTLDGCPPIVIVGGGGRATVDTVLPMPLPLMVRGLISS